MSSNLVSAFIQSVKSHENLVHLLTETNPTYQACSQTKSRVHPGLRIFPGREVMLRLLGLEIGDIM